jgi:release factor glutamine methyltransferase
VRPAEVARRAADYLARHDVESPLPTAELLLSSVLGTDRTGIYARTRGLSSSEARIYGRALCRRCSGAPVQHLTGVQGFRRISLAIRPGVFVPRPETEVLVEAALALIADTAAPVVVDVGTGAGPIALALKDERPDARVVATDLSPDAVELARENALRLGLEVEVLEGDLLGPAPRELDGAFDLVVSNPPYLSPEDAAALPREVRADPPLSLLGGIEGYERLFDEAVGRLRAGGAVVVEIGETMGWAVGRKAAEAGLGCVHVHRDLVGRDRVVTARLAEGRAAAMA